MIQTDKQQTKMTFPREIVDRIALSLPFPVALKISEHAAKEICMDKTKWDRMQHLKEMELWWMTAAKLGKLSFLGWLHSKKVPGYTRLCTDYAIRNNQPNLIKCFRRQGKYAFGGEALKEALMDGYLPVIKLFHIYQWKGWTKLAKHYANENGYLHILEYLDEHKKCKRGSTLFPGEGKQDAFTCLQTLYTFQRTPALN